MDKCAHSLRSNSEKVIFVPLLCKKLQPEAWKDAPPRAPINERLPAPRQPSIRKAFRLMSEAIRSFLPHFVVGKTVVGA